MTTINNDPRQSAIKRIEARRQFRFHLIVYVVVNAALVVIWAATGGGYFWPIWPMGGWAIGLALHGFAVYFDRPVSEDQIQAEMRRQA